MRKTLSYTHACKISKKTNQHKRWIAVSLVLKHPVQLFLVVAEKVVKCALIIKCLSVLLALATPRSFFLCRIWKTENKFYFSINIENKLL